MIFRFFCAASTAQNLIASLTPADIAALPSVPQGLQIILLPASVSLAGFPAASPIPASFTVPQQLQSYDYILTSASDPLPALPAGYNASSPTAGEHPFRLYIFLTSHANWKFESLVRSLPWLLEGCTSHNICFPLVLRPLMLCVRYRLDDQTCRDIPIIYADAAPPPPQAPAGSPISICAGAAPEGSQVGSLCAKSWCD